MVKVRLSILIPLLLILSSVASSTLLFWQEIRTANHTIQQEGSDHLNAMLTHLQNMLNTQLAADSLEDAKLSLSVTSLHPGIRTLLLADENDNVLLASRNIWIGSRAAPVSGYNDFIAQRVRQTQASSVSFNAGLLSGYYPVTLRLVAGGLGINRIGALFVEYDLGPQLAQARYDAGVQAASFGGLMIAVAVAVALLLHRLISRRVEKIVAASKRFAAGDLDARVQLRGQDELGELGHAFDDMASQRKQAETALARSHAELQRFAEISAHHLQEPARRMASYAERLTTQLAGRLDDTQARLSLEYIGQQARRQQNLLRDIERYLAADQPRGKVGLTDARKMVAEILGKSVDRIRETGAEITLGDLPAAYIDAPRLNDMFEVALENALKYGFCGRSLHIVIAGERVDGRVRYSFSDNGPGIEAEYRERVFRVFERLSSAGEGSGTGIGLAILRRVAESVGGGAWIEETPGGGCCLLFDLPSGAIS